MDRFITLIVNPEMKVACIEKGVTLQADESGQLRINVTEMLANMPNSIFEFEKEMEILLTSEQQTAIYTLWGNSRGITITDTASVLNVYKEDAKNILNIGVKHGVLCKGWNNTWKVMSKIFRERMLSYSKQHPLVDRGPKTPTEMLEVVKQQAKTMSKEYDESKEEETIEPHTAILPEEEKPIDFKVGMKGVCSESVLPGTKSLPRKLVNSPVVIPPKKRTLTKNR